jgi:hypothetical protein
MYMLSRTENVITSLQSQSLFCKNTSFLCFKRWPCILGKAFKALKALKAFPEDAGAYPKEKLGHKRRASMVGKPFPDHRGAPPLHMPPLHPRGQILRCSPSKKLTVSRITIFSAYAKGLECSSLTNRFFGGGGERLPCILGERL